MLAAKHLLTYGHYGASSKEKNLPNAKSAGDSLLNPRDLFSSVERGCGDDTVFGSQFNESHGLPHSFVIGGYKMMSPNWTARQIKLERDGGVGSRGETNRMVTTP